MTLYSSLSKFPIFVSISNFDEDPFPPPSPPSNQFSIAAPLFSLFSSEIDIVKVILAGIVHHSCQNI